MRYGHHDRVEPEFAAPHRDDDAQDEIPARSGIPRWAALALAGGAVIAFGGVVAYGYLTYADRHGATPAPLVVADQRPVRVKPDHDGGTAVPHQNIEVFDAGQRGQRSALPRGAETLLPPPETPLPKPVPAPVFTPTFAVSNLGAIKICTPKRSASEAIACRSPDARSSGSGSVIGARLRSAPSPIAAITASNARDCCAGSEKCEGGMKRSMPAHANSCRANVAARSRRADGPRSRGRVAGSAAFN